MPAAVQALRMILILFTLWDRGSSSKPLREKDFGGLRRTRVAGFYKLSFLGVLSEKNVKFKGYPSSRVTSRPA